MAKVMQLQAYKVVNLIAVRFMLSRGVPNLDGFPMV